MRTLLGRFRWFWFVRDKINHLGIIPDSGSFLKNFGKLFIYNRLASVFLMFISIMTARLLGPAEFGRIGLVGNICAFLYIPILFGANNSMYKYLPESSEEQRQKLMGTAWLGNITTSVFFGGMFLLFTGVISKSIQIEPAIWRMGVFFTIMLTFSNIAESFLRGQMMYSAIGKLKLFSAGIFFLLTLVLFLGLTPGKPDFSTYYLCNIVSMASFTILAVWKAGLSLRKLSISWDMTKQIYSLGTIVMVNMLFTAILNSSDLFIVNYFYPGPELGIYNVYQGFVKNSFTAIFFEVFAVVFLPTIAGMDKPALYQKFNRYVYWFIPVIAIITGLITAVTVLLFGRQYTLSFTYTTLVSVSIGLYSVFQMYNCIFSMEGNQGAKLCLIPLAVTMPFSLALQFWLTKSWGITGAMVAVLITNLMLVLIFKAVVAYRYRRKAVG